MSAAERSSKNVSPDAPIRRRRVPSAPDLHAYGGLLAASAGAGLYAADQPGPGAGLLVGGGGLFLLFLLALWRAHLSHQRPRSETN
jgi:hypothetical protein